MISFSLQRRVSRPFLRAAGRHLLDDVRVLDGLEDLDLAPEHLGPRDARLRHGLDGEGRRPVRKLHVYGSPIARRLDQMSSTRCPPPSVRATLASSKRPRDGRGGASSVPRAHPRRWLTFPHRRRRVRARRAAARAPPSRAASALTPAAGAPVRAPSRRNEASSEPSGVSSSRLGRASCSKLSRTGSFASAKRFRASTE